VRETNASSASPNPFCSTGLNTIVSDFTEASCTDSGGVDLGEGSVAGAFETPNDGKVRILGTVSLVVGSPSDASATANLYLYANGGKDIYDQYQPGVKLATLTTGVELPNTPTVIGPYVPSTQVYLQPNSRYWIELECGPKGFNFPTCTFCMTSTPTITGNGTVVDTFYEYQLYPTYERYFYAGSPGIYPLISVTGCEAEGVDPSASPSRSASPKTPIPHRSHTPSPSPSLGHTASPSASKSKSHSRSPSAPEKKRKSKSPSKKKKKG